MNTGRLLVLALLPVALATTSCKKQQDDEPMTAAEAQQALEETAISGEAESIISGSVEVTTDFTIGQAVQQAATEIRDFVASQLPCAEITLADATLTIEYGAKSGECTYRGHTYSGSHSVKVSKNDASDILVEHTWNDLSNGRVTVSGTAEVTWSLAEESRRVVHELTWTRLADGRTGTGSGDHTHTALEGGLEEGIRIDGTRSWEGQKGQWDLTIDGVEARWGDPVPQAGSYELVSPDDRTLTLSFSRVDDDTIRVTLEGASREFSFNVNKLGAVSGE